MADFYISSYRIVYFDFMDGTHRFYKLYTVSFDMQGHLAQSNEITVTLNGTITAPKPPTDANCIFEGWYKESTCTNQWDFDTDRVTEDITLYAKWWSTPVTNITDVPTTGTVGTALTLPAQWSSLTPQTKL